MGTPDLTSSAFWQDAAPYALGGIGPIAAAPQRSLLVQTSGTEGKPKWVVIGKDAFLASAVAVNAHLSATSADRWLIALPTHHVGGFAIYARAYESGAKVFHFEGKWDAQGFADTCERNAITLTSLVPTQVFDLVRAQLAAPPSLRAIVVGGGGLAVEIGNHARSLGWPVLQSYGMTEACSQIATEPLEHLQTAFNPCELEVLSTWQLSTTNGRLAIRGPALASGYLCETTPGNWEWQPIGEELVTRDQVALWTQGTRQYLRFEGRDSQVLKILGELVQLPQLQALLDTLAMPLGATGQAILVPVPDDRKGTALVLAHTVSDQIAVQLRENFHRRVHPWERIDRQQKVAHLPVTELGKPRMSELIELCVQSGR